MPGLRRGRSNRRRTSSVDSARRSCKVPALWSAGWYDNAGGGEMFTRDARQRRDRPGAQRDAHDHRWLDAQLRAGLRRLASASVRSARPTAPDCPQLHLVSTTVTCAARTSTSRRCATSSWVSGRGETPTTGRSPAPSSGGCICTRAAMQGRTAATAHSASTRRHPPSRRTVFTYDPMDPRPSWGFRVMYTGGTTAAGPVRADARRATRRRPGLHVANRSPKRGRSSATSTSMLYFASTAQDTDVVAKLCVVWADGSSFNLADGALRLSRRNGSGQPRADRARARSIRLKIELGPTGYKFEPGMRLRVQITSSAFPHLARNTNTGNPVARGRGRVAVRQHGVPRRRARVLRRDSRAARTPAPRRR